MDPESAYPISLPPPPPPYPRDKKTANSRKDFVCKQRFRESRDLIIVCVLLCNRLFLLDDTTQESERKRTLPNYNPKESDLDEKVTSVCQHTDKSGSHDETGKFKNKY